MPEKKPQLFFQRNKAGWITRYAFALDFSVCSRTLISNEQLAYGSSHNLLFSTPCPVKGALWHMTQRDVTTTVGFWPVWRACSAPKHNIPWLSTYKNTQIKNIWYESSEFTVIESLFHCSVFVEKASSKAMVKQLRKWVYFLFCSLLEELSPMFTCT